MLPVAIALSAGDHVCYGQFEPLDVLRLCFPKQLLTSTFLNRARPLPVCRRRAVTGADRRLPGVVVDQVLGRERLLFRRHLALRPS